MYLIENPTGKRAFFDFITFLYRNQGQVWIKRKSQNKWWSTRERFHESSAVTRISSDATEAGPVVICRTSTSLHQWETIQGRCRMEVDRLIEKDFSPEQISNRLKLEKVFAISHETIYQRIYQDKRKGRRTPFAFTESEATPKTLLHWARTTRDDQEPHQHC